MLPSQSRFSHPPPRLRLLVPLLESPKPLLEGDNLLI